MASPDTQPVQADDSRYHFETGQQGWLDVRTNTTAGVRQSTLHAFKGSASLEVALALGFYDQAHFSGTFKRFTGVTPGQFRHAARA